MYVCMYVCMFIHTHTGKGALVSRMPLALRMADEVSLAPPIPPLPPLVRVVLTTQFLLSYFSLSFVLKFASRVFSKV